MKPTKETELLSMAPVDMELEHILYLQLYAGRLRIALEKIALEDEINTNFSTGEKEAAYYIKVAKEAIGE